jgi:hypothetical protein
VSKTRIVRGIRSMVLISLINKLVNRCSLSFQMQIHNYATCGKCVSLCLCVPWLVVNDKVLDNICYIHKLLLATRIFGVFDKMVHDCGSCHSFGGKEWQDHSFLEDMQMMKWCQSLYILSIMNFNTKEQGKWNTIL